MLPDDDRLTRHSYYDDTAVRLRRFEPLEGSVECDVCVIGAGLAGLSAAIDLQRAGLSVVLLEAREVGWGASGRNGGQALVGLACDMPVIERQLGRADARKIWDMTLEGVDLIHERRLQFDIACDWQAGAIAAAVGERKARELWAWCEALERDYGYGPLRRIDRAQVRRWIDSPRYAAAAYDGRAGHLHPLKYTLGLARAATGLGARVHENSRALRLRREGSGRGTPVVETALGRVRCRFALLAGNVYLEPLAPQLARRIMPVGTFIAASARLDLQLARQLVPSRAAVFDTQFVLDYFRLSADDRLIFGGRVSYSRLAPPRLAAAMRRRMLGVFPQLGAIPVEYAWGGYVDITRNRAPDFGRLYDDVYYLQGFSGHGLALSGLAGRLVAEAITGTAARFDLFARLRHRPFPGGRWLRTPALVLAMAWYRLRDLVG